MNYSVITEIQAKFRANKGPGRINSLIKRENKQTYIIKVAADRISIFQIHSSS